MNFLEEAIERLKRGDPFHEVEQWLVYRFGGIARGSRDKQLTAAYLALMMFRGPFDSHITDGFRDELKRGELLKKRLLEEKVLNEGELIAVISAFDNIEDITGILTETGEINEESLRSILNLGIFSREKQDFFFWEIVYAMKQKLPDLQKRASAELINFYKGAIDSLSKGTNALLKFVNDEIVRYHSLTSKWSKLK